MKIATGTLSHEEFSFKKAASFLFKKRQSCKISRPWAVEVCHSFLEVAKDPPASRMFVMVR